MDGFYHIPTYNCRPYIPIITPTTSFPTDYPYIHIFLTKNVDYTKTSITVYVYPKFSLETNYPSNHGQFLFWVPCHIQLPLLPLFQFWEFHMPNKLTPKCLMTPCQWISLTNIMIWIISLAIWQILHILL